MDLGLDLRLTVPVHATRETQAAALDVDPVLAQHADDLIFGVAEPEGDEADTYWLAVEQARKSLAKQHSFLRQVRAYYNPASLVASLRRPTARARRPRLRLAVRRG